MWSNTTNIILSESILENWFVTNSNCTIEYTISDGLYCVESFYPFFFSYQNRIPKTTSLTCLKASNRRSSPYLESKREVLCELFWFWFWFCCWYKLHSALSKVHTERVSTKTRSNIFFGTTWIVNLDEFRLIIVFIETFTIVVCLCARVCMVELCMCLCAYACVCLRMFMRFFLYSSSISIPVSTWSFNPVIASKQQQNLPFWSNGCCVRHHVIYA